MRPIPAAEANALVRRVHYSGKVVNNSQLHIGVYYRGKLEGAMQFGPPLDKRKLLGLVEGTPWNGFLELNRLAFSDALPRNSESRALGIAMRMLRKHAPHVQWVVSFADGAQCGDGTIYRAAGFVLTGIRPNTSLWQGPGGDVGNDITVKAGRPIVVSRTTMTKGQHVGRTNGKASMAAFAAAGYRPIPGYQLRYLYFLDPTARERLTVPILPFSEIERRGAGMYKGQPVSRRQPLESEGTCSQQDEGAAMRPVGSTQVVR